jgi:hypothetical protein
VLRGLRRRLDRLWAVYRHEAAAREAEHDQRSCRESFVATLRAGLARARVDPATVPAMRRFDMPDPAPPPPPDHSRGPLDAFCDQLSKIVGRHRDRPLDLGIATPLELFAVYCFDAAEGPEGIALLGA